MNISLLPWNKSVTVTLTMRQWVAIHGAAANYDTRIPLEQGEGGKALDAIAAAIEEVAQPE